MIDEKKVIAIIPARGGSKRLPKKNILPIAGKPLINWTVEAAKKSKYIDRIILSTDDINIANVVSDSKIEVPELRPEYLSRDESNTVDVILYTLEKHAKGEDIVIILQPTSPLRTFNHIDEALDLFIEREALSVVSVTPCEHSPLWANTLPVDRSMKGFIKESSLKRSQDLDLYYRFNGAVYIFDKDNLVKLRSFDYENKSYAYLMDRRTSIDIDDFFDFEMAEYFLTKK